MRKKFGFILFITIMITMSLAIVGIFVDNEDKNKHTSKTEQVVNDEYARGYKDGYADGFEKGRESKSDN
jgi:uncharacterized membrane protein